MTNTKFRKRALLSSVAMLLVALIALGSATFAWFVANPTVTASGMLLQTSAAPGLAVASASAKNIYNDDANYSVTDAFGQTTVLKATGTPTGPACEGLVTNSAAFDLQPAAPKNALESSDGSLKFGRIDAADASAKTASSAETALFSEETAVASENIYLKTTTSDTGAYATVQSVGVKINPTGTNLAQKGLKVVLVGHQVAGKSYNDGSAQTTTKKDFVIGIWKVSGSIGGTSYAGQDSDIWNGTLDTAANALVANSVYTYYANTASATLASTNQLTATVDPDGTYITAYVYLDGENDGVASVNVPQAVDILQSIDIKVSTASSVSFS